MQGPTGIFWANLTPFSPQSDVNPTGGGSGFSGANISFSAGGWQTAASDQGGPFDYFIEGARSLLDIPGEWHHDSTASQLFLFPNTTGAADGRRGPPPATVVVPRLRELLSFEGSQRSPVAADEGGGAVLSRLWPWTLSNSAAAYM